LTSNDFDRGSLSVESYVRPDKLFTVEESVIKKNVGKLNAKTIKKILKKVSELFA
jgi:hypothetical protein